MLEIETIVRGRTWEFDLIHYDVYVKEGSGSNVPTNHTGWTVRSQVRRKVDGKVIANLDVTFPTPTNGSVAIRHDRDFTRALAASKRGELWWDIVGTDADGIDWPIWPPEPIEIHDWPTDPEDNSSNDFIPVGAIHHTHPISQIEGLQAILDSLQSQIDAL